MLEQRGGIVLLGQIPETGVKIIRPNGEWCPGSVRGLARSVQCSVSQDPKETVRASKRLLGEHVVRHDCDLGKLV
jgi:hypothetical protein